MSKKIEFDLTGLEVLKIMNFFNKCNIDTDTVCVSVDINASDNTYVWPMIFTEIATGKAVDVTDYREEV